MANTVMALLAAAGETVEHHEHDLPFHPYVFGAIALGLFAAALAVTWSFKGLAHGR